MRSEPPVVELAGVRRSFPGPPQVEAVRGVDLTVERCEHVAVVGPSGSGKSTLLHLLGLLDRPTTGTYRLDGIDTGGLSERARAELRGRRIGFVFQAFHVLAHRSVLENVALGLLHGGHPRAGRRDRAAAALEQVGLSHRATFTPAVLSGGERQRVAIARALAGGPSLLLADEPTGNLDRATSRAVLDVFDQLHAGGLTVVVITHDHQVAERADRRIRLVDGAICR